MNRWAFVAFAALMWVLPAAVAFALGWPGVREGGSAFADLIIPVFPGGISHLPSFVIALAIVKAYPTFAGRSAIVGRAVLLSGLALGIMQMIDLARLVEAVTTDVGGNVLRFERSYLGLCMASDALVALAWVLRRPIEKQGFLLTSLIIAVPAAMYLGSDATGLSRLQEPFRLGRPAVPDTRGEQTLWVYTRLSPDERGFRQQAGRFVTQHRPEDGIDEVLAVYFTGSLRAANAGARASVLMTLCRYGDGAPDEWHEGAADCPVELQPAAIRREQ